MYTYATKNVQREYTLKHDYKLYNMYTMTTRQQTMNQGTRLEPAYQAYEINYKTKHNTTEQATWMCRPTDVSKDKATCMQQSTGQRNSPQC